MKLKQLIREIHWVEWQLRSYEDKYGLLSQDFYKALETGQLAEFDDGEEPHFHDFLDWQALYQIWQQREQTYRKHLRHH